MLSNPTKSFNVTPLYVFTQEKSINAYCSNLKSLQTLYKFSLLQKQYVVEKNSLLLTPSNCVVMPSWKESKCLDNSLLWEAHSQRPSFEHPPPHSAGEKSSLMPGPCCPPRRLPPPQQTKQAGGRICLDRAHLVHTETVIRRALGRNGGSEEVVGKGGAGVCEWGRGRGWRRAWGSVCSPSSRATQKSQRIKIWGASSGAHRGVFVCTQGGRRLGVA